MNRWKIIILIVLVSIIITLQFAAATQKSFWEDEAWTATIIQDDYQGVLQTTLVGVHPPLYFLLATLWGQVFGYTEFALRSLSILFVVFIFGLVFIFTRTIYNDRTAWIAILLLTFSPVVLMYGHNARYYSLGAAFSLIVVLSTVKYLSTNRWFFLLFYVVGGAVLLYTVYATLSILLACNLWWLLKWWNNGRSRSVFLQWFIAQVIIILLYYPMIPIMQSVTQNNIDVSVSYGNLIVEIIKRAVFMSYAYTLGEAISPLNPVAWIGVGSLIFIVIITFVRKEIDCLFPLIILLVAVFINIFINLIAEYPNSAWQGLPHRTFFAYPFFIIFLACGIAKLKSRSLIIILCTFLIVSSLGIYNYFNNRQFIKPLLTVPWQEIVEDILASGSSNSAVICSLGDYGCPYYVKRFGLTPYNPKDLPQLIEEERDDIWWIHINLGTNVIEENSPPNINDLKKLGSPYSIISRSNYGQQDASIRWIKSSVLNMQDYEYRISVIKYAKP